MLPGLAYILDVSCCLHTSRVLVVFAAAEIKCDESVYLTQSQRSSSHCCTGSRGDAVCHADECVEWRGFRWVYIRRFTHEIIWGHIRRLHQPGAACNRMYTIFIVTTTFAQDAATR